MGEKLLMKCPKCGHTNCHYVSNTISTAKGFDVCNALCGSICLGPVGLLCGACGAGKVNTKVDEYWICNDCGAKFHAAEVKEEPTAHVKFYFEHVMEYPELEGNTIVQSFVSTYKNEIVNTPLVSHIVIRDQDDGVLKKQKQECDRGLLERSMLLFAIPEDLGLIYAVNGVFIGDTFLMAEEISAIIRYKNSVYVNGNGIQMESPELTRILYEFLCALTSDVVIKKDCETFPKALRILQRFSDRRASSTAHYSSREDYAEYISALYQKRRNDFAQANPERYREYAEAEEKEQKLSARIVWGGLALCALLTVYKLISRGLFSAIFWGFAALVVMVFAFDKIFKSEKLNAYKKLLPEAVYLLKEEVERKPLERLGMAEIYEE